MNALAWFRLALWCQVDFGPYESDPGARAETDRQDAAYRDGELCWIPDLEDYLRLTADPKPLLPNSDRPKSWNSATCTIPQASASLPRRNCSSEELAVLDAGRGPVSAICTASPPLSKENGRDLRPAGGPDRRQNGLISAAAFSVCRKIRIL